MKLYVRQWLETELNNRSILLTVFAMLKYKLYPHWPTSLIEIYKRKYEGVSKKKR